MPDPAEFAIIDLHTWEEFLSRCRATPVGWLFRGQKRERSLRSSLERQCRKLGCEHEKIASVEAQLIRDFRRRYRGPDRATVMEDTLYCLALMQHYGAPTRLLDFTYSPFIAAYFGLDRVGACPLIWCVNDRWLYSSAAKIVPRITDRNLDERRDDRTFLPIYFDQSRKFACPENPYLLNDRLVIQQGIFLCLGDVTASLEENLKALDGWKDASNVLRLRLHVGRAFLRQALADLLRMNITSATLFPGLDGFARSSRERMVLYEELADSASGERTAKARRRDR
jgi:hypothetical protein